LATTPNPSECDLHEVASRYRLRTQRKDAITVADGGRLAKAPTFYTVREAAEILRCNASTLYRAIREDAFPAIRIRGRCIVPATVIDSLAHEAQQTGACVDVAQMAAERRTERLVARLTR
jgi:excisionase family DNA binding protein